MSEPVSNVEIEDVLSSIRRLVSEENRPPLRRAPKEKPDKPTRLVLTPSLLVPDSGADGSADEAATETVSESAEYPAETQQSADPAPDELDTAHEDSELNAEELAAPDFVAEIDGSKQEAPEEATTDFAAEPAEEYVEDLVLATETNGSGDPTGSEQAGDDDLDSGSQTDQAPWVDPDATLYEAAESVETSEDSPSDDDEELTDEGLAETQPETFVEGPERPDNQSDDVVSDETSTQPGWWRAQSPDEDAQHQEAKDDAEDAAHADFPGSANEISGDPDEAGPQPTGDDRLNTATLSDKIAVLEAKIGQTQDQWEPDGETDDDYAGTPVETIEWQDHEAEPEAEFASPEAKTDFQEAQDTNATAAPDQAVPHTDEDALDILSEDDTILDEESLRELVAEIVRQELQGALGERITRNVRKLVRREIHRALTAQELD